MKIQLLWKLQSYKDGARKCARTTHVNVNKGRAIQILLYIPVSRTIWVLKQVNFHAQKRL